MTSLPPDPLDAGGIAGFARDLRAGHITAEAASRAYLDRVAVLEPRLQAFEHVDGDRALSVARALDALLAAGTDLGPLMGVPVTVKDLFAVDGLAVHAGSNIDLSDVIGAEGPFIKTLKRAGCVIIGTVKSPEFAMGSAGMGNVSILRGAPWNPWDAVEQRAPGVSSSGSAVAVAAGLCAWSVGTDTGGSVRSPAAYCGLFGLKTTAGRFPAGGMFPQAPALDSIGPLTRTATDGALVFAALTGIAEAPTPPPEAIRLGRPTSFFFEELEPSVARAVEGALKALAAAGVTIVPVDIPEAWEVAETFGPYTPAHLIAIIGRERFLAERARMDPRVAPRVARGLEVTADSIVRLERRRRALVRIVHGRLAGLDGFVMPTAAFLPPPLADLDGKSPEALNALMAARRTHRRSFANICGLTAFTTPVQQFGADLPVGLQVMGRGGDEANLLAVARTIESITGPPPRPDLSGFLS